MSVVELEEESKTEDVPDVVLANVDLGYYNRV